MAVQFGICARQGRSHTRHTTSNTAWAALGMLPSAVQFGSCTRPASSGNTGPRVTLGAVPRRDPSSWVLWACTHTYVCVCVVVFVFWFFKKWTEDHNLTINNFNQKLFLIYYIILLKYIAILLKYLKYMNIYNSQPSFFDIWFSVRAKNANRT